MRRITRRTVAAGAVVLLVGTLTGCDRWIKELASVNHLGTDSGNGPSTGSNREDSWRYNQPIFSADGSTLVFVSQATDLVPDGGNGAWQVYARDIDTGVTTLVSVNAAGTGGGFGTSAEPSVSADGTRIAFRSLASDLGPPDPRPRTTDIYVRDLVAGTTGMASVNTAGTGGGNNDSFNPAISPDGTKVVFSSRAWDMAPQGVSGTQDDLFVRDLTLGTTNLLNVNLAGTREATGAAASPAFSPDSTKVAFASPAPDLVPDDTNGVGDTFLHDFSIGRNRAVTVDPAGRPVGGGSRPVFGPVGTVLAYQSAQLGGLVVEDLGTGSRTVIPNASFPAFSPDGTKVGFISWQGGFGPPDTNNDPDIYVRDLVTGSTVLASTNADGTNGGNSVSVYSLQSDTASFNHDGTKVSFTSTSSDLGPADTNDLRDIYVRDLTIGVTSLVSSRADGADSGNGTSESAVFRPGGDEIAFYSRADDLGVPDTRGGTGGAAGDIYVARIAPPAG